MFSNPKENTDSQDESRNATANNFYEQSQFLRGWNNLKLQDEEISHSKSQTFTNDKALRMMTNMGFKIGSGLGKNAQGITQSIAVPYHQGRRGFGFLNSLENSNEIWDFTNDVIEVKENVIWLPSENQDNFSYNKMKNWIKEGSRLVSVEGEYHFCDKNVLHGVLNGKNIFDELNVNELGLARPKANPFETIRSAFFMNRAALKMANIDAVTDFMFTHIDQNDHHKRTNGLYYFADVCAGPGGFTEYVLWRKKWMFKGFGLTLKDDNDFKVDMSTCASSATFGAYYGQSGDGDICRLENLTDFKEKVLHQTENLGVHFMMADGGFSVEGKENLQEVLSKNIYVCQCLLALEIVREHGHFVTKLFDVFTPFSVGLIYLLWDCFERVTIFKPNTSRPANSERYFICLSRKNNSRIANIRLYLKDVATRVWELKTNSDLDVLEIVPLNLIKDNEKFFSFITNINNSLGKRQIINLQKLGVFCKNPNLIDLRQEELRKKCLSFWQIPDVVRKPIQNVKADELIASAINNKELILMQPRIISNLKNLASTILDVEDWHFCCLTCNRTRNICNFYAGIGNSKVVRFQSNKWIRVKNLNLVQGTVLYGELVKEYCQHKKSVGDSKKVSEKEDFKYSLHVIDALQLGDVNLLQYPFHERMELIDVYCKAVNYECCGDRIRIRQKKVHPLKTICGNLIKGETDQAYYCKLPRLGYKTGKEYFDVNSIFLLKTNEYQTFQSTYVLRVQIYLKDEGHDNTEEYFTLRTLQEYIRDKMSP